MLMDEDQLIVEWDLRARFQKSRLAVPVASKRQSAASQGTCLTLKDRVRACATRRIVYVTSGS